jgi:hypothetical protein
MKRLLTERQVRRLKFMCTSSAALFLLQFCAEKVAAATRDQYDGPFFWNGKEYSQFKRTATPTGYIDEYTNKEGFCER